MTPIAQTCPPGVAGVPSPGRRLAYGLLVLSALALGAFLRLHLLADQVLLDDEWHGLYYVLNKPFAYLLTHFSIPGATCTPLHLYHHVLLGTTGWSELLLRLPSVAAGLLSLVLFPLMLRDVLSRRALAIFCFLLALSPFLIFYSRFARPYGAEVLFGFLALLAVHRWALTGRRRWAVLYGAAGVLTVYFHLFGIVAVVVPPAVLLLAKQAGQRFPAAAGPGAIRPSARSIIIVLALTLALSALLVLPAFINAARTSLNTVAGAGDPRHLSPWRVLEMLAGTADPVLTALFGLLACGGLAALLRHDRVLAWILIAVGAGFAAALAISRPHSMHAPIVVCRYVIPVFPAVFVLVALGLDRLLGRLENLAGPAARPRVAGLCQAAAGVFLAGLGWAGPLRQTYTPGNAFTSHAVFQDSYRPVDWRESFRSEMTPADYTIDTTLSRSDVSPFYRHLAANTAATAIIEFPMLVGDHFNPHYYYQHVHGKRVLAGYSRTYPDPATLGAGCVFGNTYIDEVLSLVPAGARLRFRNLVPIDEVAAIRSSGADYLVIHRRFGAEFDRVARPHPCLPALDARCRAAFGTPAFEDATVTVFQVGGADE